MIEIVGEDTGVDNQCIFAADSVGYVEVAAEFADTAEAAADMLELDGTVQLEDVVVLGRIVPVVDKGEPGSTAEVAADIAGVENEDIVDSVDTAGSVGSAAAVAAELAELADIAGSADIVELAELADIVKAAGNAEAVDTVEAGNFAEAGDTAEPVGPVGTTDWPCLADLDSPPPNGWVMKTVRRAQVQLSLKECCVMSEGQNFDLIRTKGEVSLDRFALSGQRV